MPVAPRTVNDFSYLMRMTDRSHFSWLAQYLVRRVMPVALGIENDVSQASIMRVTLRGGRSIW